MLLAKVVIRKEKKMKDEKKIDVEDKLLEFDGETSVLPMYISKSGLGPATEVIVCSAISGGAKYKDGMPKELTLVRKLLNGKEYTAQYEIKKGGENERRAE